MITPETASTLRQEIMGAYLNAQETIRAESRSLAELRAAQSQALRAPSCAENAIRAKLILAQLKASTARKAAAQEQEVQLTHILAEIRAQEHTN